ncbi:MAG TPA: tRNA pseudouridine(38-40) synthase TruA [Rhizomicrobium sp.]|jgi:tRNA pseudouridine38-40 synthase|nr:tRNA pseudouridine(38-40) synthase TruA [Rhizomicrobium sp.]
MPRFKLTVEYDGTGFVGWQRQDNGSSIQGALEEAILKLCGEQVTVHGAGRTDAGVHALGQVAHFDLAKEFAADKVRDALNHHLRPARIAVLEAEDAAPDFHARFSAKARHYRYRIVCRRAPLAIDEGRAWHVVRDLDADVMDIAAQALVGHHDFTTFRSSECQAKSPVKTLDKFTIHRAENEIHFDVSSRSFLHNQVRSMVGSLKLVGEGKWLASDIARALQAKDRAACGPVAPPDGLYLTRVDYT